METLKKVTIIDETFEIKIDPLLKEKIKNLKEVESIAVRLFRRLEEGIWTVKKVDKFISLKKFEKTILITDYKIANSTF